MAAEIFPNAEWLEQQGITDTRAHLEAEIEQFNKQLPPYKNITKVKLRDTEFPKTSSRKIRRSVS